MLVYQLGPFNSCLLADLQWNLLFVSLGAKNEKLCWHIIAVVSVNEGEMSATFINNMSPCTNYPGKISAVLC